MRQRHPIKMAAGFASALLFVFWIGGSCGAAAYKTVYWLVFGVWPETAVYVLVPAPLIREVLALPQNTVLSQVLLTLLSTDIMTYLLVVPPILLLPCLLVLFTGQPPRVAWRMAVKPFAPRAGGQGGSRRDAGFFRRSRGFSDSGKANGSTNCR